MVQTKDMVTKFTKKRGNDMTKIKYKTISQKKWNEKKKHGYTSKYLTPGQPIPVGTKMILDMDKKTGGTVLIPVKIKKD